MCSDSEPRWVDVFLTRPDIEFTAGTTDSGTRSGSTYSLDDEFVMTVQNVRLNPLLTGSYSLTDESTRTAVITEDATEWLMGTYTNDLRHTSFATVPGLQVGDLVRIGNSSSGGLTDYLTILDVVLVGKLFNATTSNAAIDVDGTMLNSGATALDISTYTANNNLARKVFRVNRAVQVTKMPTNFPTNGQVMSTSGTNVTLATRHEASLGTLYKESDPGNNLYEHLLYPLYRAVNFADDRNEQRKLRVHLDTRFKKVHCVQLVAYELANKPQVDFAHAHELSIDDYIVMRVRELEGDVVSNNRHANGAFAVLNTGAMLDNPHGGRYYSQYEKGGIVTQRITPAKKINSLTLDISDRKGNPARLGRVHFWFKVLASS